MLQIVYNWLIPFVLGGAATFIIATVKHYAKKERAEAAGVCCLLRAEIIRQHEKYTEKGFCPIYAKEALKKAYEAYHDLGGNDVATKLFDEVMALPEKPKSLEIRENGGIYEYKSDN